MEFALLLIHSGIPTLLIAPRNLAWPGKLRRADAETSENLCLHGLVLRFIMERQRIANDCFTSV